MKRFLALGAGVQSTTVLLMSCVGELPRLDGAIFADTGWEPKAVYVHLAWLEEEAAKYNIPVSRVSKGDLRADALISRVRGTKVEGTRWASMPLYTKVDGQEKEGMIRRQCTNEYKIEPIQKDLRARLGYEPRQVIPTAAIEQWFGISRDEMRRARISQVRWIINRYPLIFDVPKTRQQCLQWLAEHGYPEPPRSACIGCPFRSAFEWRQMRDERPEEWDDAVSFDKAIRNNGGLRGQVFLHRQCVPLDEVDLSTAEERGQLSLWNNECQGMCGV